MFFFHSVIENYCVSDPTFDHALSVGTFERTINEAANMACDNGYNAVVTGDSLKMICSGATAENGVWTANGVCESMLLIKMHHHHHWFA